MYVLILDMNTISLWKFKIGWIHDLSRKQLLHKKDTLSRLFIQMPWTNKYIDARTHTHSHTCTPAHTHDTGNKK